MTTDNGGADGTIVIEKTLDKVYNYYRYGDNYKSLYEIDNYV